MATTPVSGFPSITVEMAFGTAVNTAASSWSDVTAYVRGWGLYSPNRASDLDIFSGGDEAPPDDVDGDGPVTSTDADLARSLDGVALLWRLAADAEGAGEHRAAVALRAGIDDLPTDMLALLGRATSGQIEYVPNGAILRARVGREIVEFRLAAPLAV
jgi:hypothetical protein